MGDTVPAGPTDEPATAPPTHPADAPPEPAAEVAELPPAAPPAEAVAADSTHPDLDPAGEADAAPEEEPAATEAVGDDSDIDPGAGAEVAPADGAGEPVPVPPPESPKKWYVVKVQSGREETIKKDIERKVKIRSLEEFYGQIAVPVEEYYEKKKVSVKDKKTGQRVTEERNVTKRRKKFPGYIFAEVEYNENILYLFRETSGVGDFVGATHTRAPNPMPEREVQQMLTGVIDPKDKSRKVKVKLDFEKGDKVRIRDGAFAGSEGEVKAISEPKDPTDIPKVTVIVSIWGRPVELELESLQVDKV